MVANLPETVCCGYDIVYLIFVWNVCVNKQLYSISIDNMWCQSVLLCLMKYHAMQGVGDSYVQCELLLWQCSKLIGGVYCIVVDQVDRATLLSAL